MIMQPHFLSMETENTAIELMKDFIRLVHEYRKTLNPDILPRLKKIAEQYEEINGFGGIYKITNSEDLKY